jgi:hypothetical protein
VESRAARYTALRSQAITRGIPFSLTRAEFGRLWGQPCAYCGTQANVVGIDRIDSTGGYDPANVVPCCWLCNLWKSALTLKQFRAHVERLHAVLIRGEPVEDDGYRPPESNWSRKRRPALTDVPPLERAPRSGGRAGRSGRPLRFSELQIAEALAASGGTVTGAARRLKCDRVTVHRYLRRYPDLEQKGG